MACPPPKLVPDATMRTLNRRARCGLCLQRWCYAPKDVQTPCWSVWAVFVAAVVSLVIAFVVLILLIAFITINPVPQDTIRDVTAELGACWHAVMTRNQVPYFLAYGSLLGAIRRQDFLPHDVPVDIDLGVFECDTARILALTHEFKRECGAELIHRTTGTTLGIGVGFFHIRKSAFRLFYNRFGLPAYVDVQDHELYTDPPHLNNPSRESIAASFTLGGCPSLSPTYTPPTPAVEAQSELNLRGLTPPPHAPVHRGKEGEPPPMEWVAQRPDIKWFTDAHESLEDFYFNRVDRVAPVVNCPFLMRGVQYLCPHDHEYLMQQSYGPDWRIPKTGFKVQNAHKQDAGAR